MNSSKSSFRNKEKPRILIVKPSSLGDIFHVLPALKIIKQQIPGAEIDWLVNKSFAPLICSHPDIRNVIVFPRKELAAVKTFFPALTSLVGKLRSEKYDLVIDFQGLFRSAIFSYLSGAKTVAGFASPKEKISAIFYNIKVEIPEKCVHAVEKNAFLASYILGIDYQEPPSPLVQTAPAGAKSVKKLFADENIPEDAVLAAVISGARWQSKKWPEDFFADVVKGVSVKHPELIFLLTGTPEDIESAERIKSLCGTSSKLRILTGRTNSAELIELMRNCRFVLTNDSGPMHIAAALNIPVFALFGPTVPEKTGPFGHIHRVFQAESSCIKCLKRYCPDGTYKCHREIKTELVAESINNFLDGR